MWTTRLRATCSRYTHTHKPTHTHTHTHDTRGLAGRRQAGPDASCSAQLVSAQCACGAGRQRTAFGWGDSSLAGRPAYPSLLPPPPSPPGAPCHRRRRRRTRFECVRGLAVHIQRVRADVRPAAGRGWTLCFFPLILSLSSVSVSQLAFYTCLFLSKVTLTLSPLIQ